MPEFRPPTIAEDDASFGQVLEEIAGAEYVAVDTEADSFYSYREKICLVQLSTAESDYLVDPLQGLDLRPLGRLLADPKILKIFHAGENDIIMLRQQFDFTFRNLFDTLIAAQVIGIRRCSLKAMLEDQFGVSIDKAQQRSDWGKRPLSEAQLRYAALDTHYLSRLRERLVADIDRLGRRAEAEAEFRALESRSSERKEFDPNECMRIRGARDLDERAFRIFRDVYVLRERLAQEEDVPPFRVFTDATLLAVATRQPPDWKAIQKVPGFRGRALRRYAEPVLEAVRNAREQGPLRFPDPSRTGERPPFDPGRAALYDHLRRWREGVAADREVETFRVAKNELLSAIVKSWPRTLAELAAVPGMEPWRMDTHGEQLLGAILAFDGPGESSD